MERCVTIGNFNPDPRPEPAEARYCLCGTRLARDNPTNFCWAHRAWDDGEYDLVRDAGLPADRPEVNVVCECGTLFIQYRPHGLFCSPKCAQRARDARRNQLSLEAS